MPLPLSPGVKRKLPALTLAAETNCPLLTAAPDNVRLPAPGRVVILTLASVLAGESLESEKPKSATVKV